MSLAEIENANRSGFVLRAMIAKYICQVNSFHIFCVHGSMHRESMSIIVERDATIHSFIIFLQTAPHVSDDTLIHHQGLIQTVISTSGTGRIVFATVR